MLNKKEQIRKVSDPDVVYHNAVMLLGQYDDFKLELSTRKNKKYMISGSFTNNKWIHFGDMRYEDFTKHNDKERRKHFLKRNVHWIRNDYSPAFFSYYLLW